MVQGTDSSQELAKTEKRESMLRLLLVIFMLHMSSIMVTIDSRMMVYLNAFKGDTARVASTNAKGMMMMLGSNLILTPLISIFSQAQGRWPVMFIGGFSHIIMQIINLISPTPGVVLATTGASAICTVTMLGAMQAIGDVFAGDPQAAGAAMAKVQAGQLAASVFSPFLGAALAARGVRVPLVCGVALSAAELVLVRQLPETLPEAQMRPMGDANWAAAQPLGFLKLFLRGPRLAALALVHLITEITDPLVMNRTASLVHMESLGWSVANCGGYTSISSAVAVPGYVFAGRVLKAIGTVPALAMSGIGIALHHFLEGGWVSQAWQQFALLPLLLTRGSTTASLQALLMETGLKAGFVQGELRGYLQSMKYLAGVLGFPLWAALFARSVQNKVPRQFFLGLATLVAVQMAAGQVAATLPKPEEKGKTQ